MSNNLRFAVFMVALILFASILYLFKKGKIPLKYTLVWLIPALVILFVALIPDALIAIMQLFGFRTMSNMIIGLLFVIMIYICISLTIIVSGQKTKIKLLVQEISMLKSMVDKDCYEKDDIHE